MNVRVGLDFCVHSVAETLRGNARKEVQGQAEVAFIQ